MRSPVLLTERLTGSSADGPQPLDGWRVVSRELTARARQRLTGDRELRERTRGADRRREIGRARELFDRTSDRATGRRGEVAGRVDHDVAVRTQSEQRTEV